MLLGSLRRLGENSESFENKIALCKNCHDQQDYHTTQDDYLDLLGKKLRLLERTDLHDVTLNLGLEQEIADVVKNVCSLKEEELAKLSYTPVKLAQKFSANDSLLKSKISMYVTNYYPYIRDLFKSLEGANGFRLDTLSLQIKCCFTKMEVLSDDKSLIFEQIVDWVMAKTLSTSRDACEAIVSFFVQNCEVFHEITE